MEREELERRLADAIAARHDRFAPRGHALYCASVVYNGWLGDRARYPEPERITALADQFVEWLEAEPGPDTGGTRP